MERLTLTRGERTLDLYIVLAAGWLAFEIRRDSRDAHGTVTATTLEARSSHRDRADELLSDVAEEFKRAGWQ